ncbi:hypothetical protein B0H11DRAFT_1905334 [Mycena galericulata]|nr:hypothetical protein B0H11DRAFT_1905334 [Mycena galericulata]
MSDSDHSNGPVLTKETPYSEWKADAKAYLRRKEVFGCCLTASNDAVANEKCAGIFWGMLSKDVKPLVRQHEDDPKDLWEALESILAPKSSNFYANVGLPWATPPVSPPILPVSRCHPYLLAIPAGWHGALVHQVACVVMLALGVADSRSIHSWLPHRADRSRPAVLCLPDGDLADLTSPSGDNSAIFLTANSLSHSLSPKTSKNTVTLQHRTYPTPDHRRQHNV